jgi:hypothetical protein
MAIAQQAAQQIVPHVAVGLAAIDRRIHIRLHLHPIPLQDTPVAVGVAVAALVLAEADQVGRDQVRLWCTRPPKCVRSHQSVAKLKI